MNGFCNIPKSEPQSCFSRSHARTHTHPANCDPSVAQQLCCLNSNCSTHKRPNRLMWWRWTAPPPTPPLSQCWADRGENTHLSRSSSSLLPFTPPPPIPSFLHPSPSLSPHHLRCNKAAPRLHRLSRSPPPRPTANKSSNIGRKQRRLSAGGLSPGAFALSSFCSFFFQTRGCFKNPPPPKKDK